MDAESLRAERRGLTGLFTLKVAALVLRGDDERWSAPLASAPEEKD